MGFTLVVLLVTFVSIWTIMNIVSVGDRSTQVVNRELRNVGLSHGMRQILLSENDAVVRFLNGSRPVTITRDTLYSLQELFHRELEQTRGSTTDSAGVAILERIGAGYHAYSLRVAELISASTLRRGGDADHFRMYASVVAPAYETVTSGILAFQRLNYDRAVTAMSAVRSGARFTAYSTTIIACLILILCVVASLKVSQTVLSPIQQLSASVRKIAGGDFRQEIGVGEADDELTGLIRDFNAMARRLQEYDATKLEQIVEEKRRCEKIVRDLSDVIIATDENAKVIYYNQEAEMVLGLPARLILGDHLTELASEHILLEKMRSDVADGRLDSAEETVTFRTRGREGAFAYRGQTIRNDADDVIGYVFRLKDITRYKQLDELKTKVVTVVSHELRTPLTSIGMSLELFAENDFGTTLDSVQRDLLRNMQEDVRRLQAFVNDLLDISRIESGALDLSRTPNRPRDLVEEAVRQMRPLTEPQDIRIDVTGVSAELPKVEVDRTRTVQILNNLFTNAIRYTPYSGTIVVSAAAQDGMIRFRVRDNGPGIPISEARQIFEKFYQIRDDQRAGGPGLGLTIVKEIVESHGGSVWVESAVGQGSSFYFTLPIATGGDVP
jgi:PAS domain S-box-containing protein